MLQSKHVGWPEVKYYKQNPKLKYNIWEEEKQRSRPQQWVNVPTQVEYISADMIFSHIELIELLNYTEKLGNTALYTWILPILSLLIWQLFTLDIIYLFFYPSLYPSVCLWVCVLCCVCLYTPVHTLVHVEAQHQVSSLFFVCTSFIDKGSLAEFWALRFGKAAWPISFRDPPVSVPQLWDGRHTPSWLANIWWLEIQIHTHMLTLWALYWLNHLPTPSIFQILFYTLTFCCI